MYTLRKKTRKSIFITFSIILFILIGLATVEIMLPDIEWVKEPLIKGSGASNITYNVILNDNPVFEDKEMPQGEYYIKPFINYMDIYCDLSLETDKEAAITITDQIDVLLISQVGTEEDLKIIWKKKKSFAVPKSTETTDKEFQSKRFIRLRFDEYDALVESLIEDYELVTDYVLKVLYEGTVVMDYQGIGQEEKFSSYIIIPFTNPIIEVSGMPQDSRDVAIEHEIKVNKGFNISLLILYLAAMLFCVSSIIIIRFKTKVLVKEDKYSQTVADIFKEYGNRLAGLSETLAYQSSVMISIDKIEDVVKIADEIGQAVFYYQAEEKTERKIEFYVFDEGRIYYMVLFGSL